MRIRHFLPVMLIGLLSGSACTSQPQQVVPDVIQPEAQAFPLSDVRLLDGPFKHAQDVEAAYLLELEPDRLLHRFRAYAGLEPKGENYGGWEQETLSGHTLGHYLTACVKMYQATANEEFKTRANYIVTELAECQTAQGNGYVGGIPRQDTFWYEVAAGNIRSAGFDLNGAWAPWYTIHKMLAGLFDVYYELDNQEALNVIVKFCDWACTTFGNLTEEQFQKMLDCEHGGMNEMMAEAYAATGNQAYWEMALKFNHKRVLDPLSEGQDVLPGKHSNTQIPKIIGMARQYELSGEEKPYNTALFFWNTVVYHHSYVTGGNSNGEYFGPADHLNDRLSASTTETCNTYNMLKLTRKLMLWETKVEYGDYYERALYNHILASQDPEDGMCTYFVPLQSGTEKTYNDKFHSFTCCSGTGMENHGKYGETIFLGHVADDGLMVNLYIPSKLEWKAKKMTVTLETTYPASNQVSLTFTGKTNTFPIYFRYPAWALSGFTASLNGSPLEVTAEPNMWVKIEGTWKEGDVLTIQVPFGLRTESMPDNPNRLAIFYGPALLAGELGTGYLDPVLGIPVLLTNQRPVDEWVKVVNQDSLIFKTENVGQPGDISLIPFYRMHHQKHMVYFDVFTDETWVEKKAEFEAELKKRAELEARTIDFVQTGEMQPERDHNQQGERTGVGDFGGKKYREASSGGWFSLDMKVDQRLPMTLQCTWWGSDGGRRSFDILVDDVVLATERLNYNRRNEFYDQDYPIPSSLTKGKDKITVKFVPKDGNTAGGLFGMRIVK